MERPGMMIYFDNLSIHGVDVSKVNQSEDLYFFLEKKIVDKCNSKTEGLQKEENGYHINGKVSEFHVAPFLWNIWYIFVLFKFKRDKTK